MTKTKGINLADFDTVAAANRGAELELVHPREGTPLGVFIKLMGSESTEWSECVNERRNKTLLSTFQAQRGGGKKPVAPTVEEIDREAITLLTRVTLGWRTGDEPTVMLGDEVLTFNHANVEKLYTSQRWVRDQVDAFVGEVSNFT